MQIFRQNRAKIKFLAATIMGSSTQKLYLCSLSSDAEFYRSVRTSGFIAVLTTFWKSRVRFFWKTNFAPRHPFFQTLGFLGQMDFGNGSQRNVKSSGRNQTDLAGLWWRISDVPRAQAKPPLNAMFCDMFWQIKTLQNFMNHASDHGKSCRKPLENHWNQVKQLFPPPKKKVIDHPPICTLSNAGVPDSPPETQHLKSSLMIGTQRPSGPSRLPTERTWISHTSCGNLVALLKEHKVKKNTYFWLPRKKCVYLPNFHCSQETFDFTFPRVLTYYVLRVATCKPRISFHFVFLPAVARQVALQKSIRGHSKVMHSSNSPCRKNTKIIEFWWEGLYWKQDDWKKKKHLFLICRFTALWLMAMAKII